MQFLKQINEIAAILEVRDAAKRIVSQGDPLIAESTDLSGYVNLLNDVAMFLTLNTAHIQQYSKDEQSKEKLKEMQRELKNPVLNGMGFVELHSKPQTYKMKNVIPYVLRYIYNLIKYVEPRLERYVQPGYVHKFQDRVESIKRQYSTVVKELTP